MTENRDGENIMGKSIGDCIHCYEYRSLRLCALNDSVCVEEDECHCDNFVNRNEEASE